MSLIFKTNQWDEAYIELLNRFDFDTISSKDRYRQCSEFDFSKKNHLYIVIGSDSGLLIRHAMRCKIGKGTRIAIIEPEHIHDCIRQKYDSLLRKANRGKNDLVLSLHKQEFWIDEVFEEAENRWFTDDAVSLVHSIACTEDYPGCYYPLSIAVNRVLREKRTRFLFDRGLRQYTNHMISNAADSKRLLPEKPAIDPRQCAVIVGRDESLATSINWITKNSDKLLIVALLEASEQLLDAGLKPDVVVCDNPGSETIHMPRSEKIWSDVPLLHSSHVAPRIVQQWPGPSSVVGKTPQWLNSNSAIMAEVVTGRMSSTTAASVCLTLGFRQILLCGIDFCQDISQPADPQTQLASLAPLAEVSRETSSGVHIGSTFLRLMAIQEMETLAKQANQETPVIFSLSSLSIQSPWIPTRTIDELFLPDQKLDIRTIIDCQQTSPQQLDELKSNIPTAIAGFLGVRKYASDALRSIHKVFKSQSQSGCRQCFRQLDKLQRQLPDYCHDFLHASQFNEGFELARLDPGQSDEASNELTRLRKSLHYYNNIEQTAAGYINQLNRLKTRIEFREMESDCDTRLEDLLNFWTRDNTPGRALKLRTLQTGRDSSRCIDPADAEQAIASSVQAFDEAEQLVDDKRIRSDNNRHVGHWVKILLYMHRSDELGELRSLCDLLEHPDWHYTALRSFCRGLIAEMEANEGQSAAHYQAVIDYCSTRMESTESSFMELHRLIEESLLRLTQINTRREQTEAAQLTLGMLCELFPQYTVSYATLLASTGQTALSYEMLRQRILETPDDSEALHLFEKFDVDLLNSANSDNQYQATVRDALSAIVGDVKAKPDLAA